MSVSVAAAPGPEGQAATPLSPARGLALILRVRPATVSDQRLKVTGDSMCFLLLKIDFISNSQL